MSEEKIRTALSAEAQQAPARGMSRREILKLAGSALALSILPSMTGPRTAAAEGEKNMKIVMLTGSPHKNGTSALLAEEFSAGAQEKGHTIVRFDTAFEKIGPCRGCYYCDKHDGVCVQQDAMQKILPEVLSADMLVLVTPIYYYGMSAQLKAAMDRFCAQRAALRKHPMKSALIATCGGEAQWSMDGLLAHYECLLKYLPWEDKGTLFAKKVFARKDVEQTDFPAQARIFGANL